MSEPLSAADRASLAAERAAVNMAVGGLLVLDRDERITRETLVQRIGERIHLAPRLRQRLDEPVMGLANPLWVDDRHFDIDWHVRSTSLPAPGSDADLGALVGREMSRRLDRSRPLWELTVIEGLHRGEQVAVLARLHHALVDGLAAMAIAMVILDPGPEPMPLPPAEDWEPRRYALRDQLMAYSRGPRTRAQRLMVEGLSRMFDPDPRRAAGEVRRTSELLLELARNRPQAPALTLNEPLTPGRRFGIARGDLAALKTAGRAAGGTVNDAILAAVADMLGRCLPRGGGARAPVALVPVSVRRPGEEGGNRISTVLVDLPTDIADPQQRIAAIATQTRALKDSAAVRAGALMVGAAGFAPPMVSSLLARGLAGVRAFNLVVSNLPGPQQPLYLAGARVRELIPIVPLNPANQRLSVGVLSYDGGVFFGLLGDRELQPPLSGARDALEQALAELSALY
jgi:diacylglycerol O-acyltransferase / wax synthase